MCCSDPPRPPDPFAIAAAQGAANKEAAIAGAELGMINQSTPYGTLQYSQRGTTEAGTPQYTASQQLAPAQQEMLDIANQAGIQYGQTGLSQLGQVAETLSSPINLSSLGPTPVANEETRRATSEAIMGRLDPQIERDRSRLEDRLVAQGIPIGSTAYNEEMARLDRSVADTRLAADAAAGAEMARTYGLEEAAYRLGRANLFDERTQPMRELSFLLTGAEPTTPQFIPTPTPTVAPTDVTGPAYASYQGDLSAHLGQMGGIYDLLGTGLMAGAYASPWEWGRASGGRG